jgi:nucleoside-triphosphate--adenylate kinase
VNLDVPDSVILSRIADRWVHLPSGRVYNSSYNAPKTPGRDDATGELLVQRPDDTPEVFARRLQQFYAATSPLLAYYAQRPAAPLVALAGSSSDEIWPHLDAAVRRVCPTLPVRADAARERGRDEKRNVALADAARAEEKDAVIQPAATPASR